MNNESYLTKLLKGVEVKWMPLRSVTHPTQNIRWRDTDGELGYIDLTSVSIETKRINETILISSESAPSRAQKLVTENDVIFATTRPAQLRYCLIDSDYEGAVASTGYCVLRAQSHIVEPKWILHWMGSTKFKNYVEENQSGSAYPAISDAKVKEFPIPIPCPSDPKRSLEIQGEIVRILDTFTELTAELNAELNAELTARKKQYNYYRDQLLRYDDGDVEWKTLAEIAYFQNAKAHERLVTPDGDVALLTSKFISTEGRSARFIKTEDVLTPAQKNDIALVMSDLPNGRALAKTFFVDESGRYAANQRVCLLTVKDPSLYAHKFLHYVMNRNRQLLAYNNGMDQTHLKKDWILNVTIPVPPLAEQVRVVAILDKFDVLSRSITEGLPREIELRQKQYEYYRDLLLSFPKPDGIAIGSNDE